MGGRLLLDAGEFWLEMRPVAGEKATYLFFDGPLGAATDSVTFEEGADSRPAMTLVVTEADGEALTYGFDRVTP